jgi:hypothetical protein
MLAFVYLVLSLVAALCVLPLMYFGMHAYSIGALSGFAMLFPACAAVMTSAYCYWRFTECH